jgi:predicted DNA-binding protein (UPF0251 family)
MPRPKKWKKVFCLPDSTLYGPVDELNQSGDIIIMLVEEYETIRLIDLENMTQQECAQNMDVARATVQRLYNNARRKIASSVVNGNILKIDGGDYILHDENEFANNFGRRRRYRGGRNFKDQE